MALYLFDLDGTLISSYMDEPDRNFHTWRLLPGRAERIAALRSASHTIVVITNQAGVAFGLTSEEDVERKLAEVARALGYGHVALWTGGPEWREFPSAGRGGSGVLEVYACYSDDRSRTTRYRHGAERRKPSGAMLREALADDARAGYPQQHRPGGVLYVGDRPEDKAAAAAAGVVFQWTASFFGD